MPLNFFHVPSFQRKASWKPQPKQHRSLDRSSEFPPPPARKNKLCGVPPGCPVRFSPSRLVSHGRHRLSAEISPCGKVLRETARRSTSAYCYSRNSAPRHCKALRSDLLAFNEKRHEGEGICRYLTTACLVLSQLVLPYNRRPIALCFSRIHTYKLPMLHPASACKPHAARPSLHLIPKLVFSLPSASMRYIRGICIRWTSNKPQAAHRT